jgi:hypothetical protein
MEWLKYLCAGICSSASLALVDGGFLGSAQNPYMEIQSFLVWIRVVSTMGWICVDSCSSSASFFLCLLTYRCLDALDLFLFPVVVRVWRWVGASFGW